MAISSISELEAVLSQTLLKIDKVVFERVTAPELSTARRDLQRVLDGASKDGALKERASLLERAAATVRKEIPADQDLHAALWDCIDYVEDQC